MGPDLLSALTNTRRPAEVTPDDVTSAHAGTTRVPAAFRRTSRATGQRRRWWTTFYLSGPEEKTRVIGISIADRTSAQKGIYDNGGSVQSVNGKARRGGCILINPKTGEIGWLEGHDYDMMYTFDEDSYQGDRK